MNGFPEDLSLDGLSVCVQWSTFGPYHVARLKAATQIFEAAGARLVALETSMEDAAGSKQVAASLTIDRFTLFPQTPMKELPPARIARAVGEKLDSINPDVVAITSYSLPDARAALGWCIRNNRRAVLMTDSRREDGRRIYWREKIKSTMVSAFDAALVAGTPHRRYLIDLGFPESKIFDGYDVVDNDFFASGSRRGLSSGKNGATFLAVGRLIERKGFEVLIRAYQKYREAQTEPWDLVIVGDGRLRAKLDTLIVSLDVHGITFAGQRSYDDMPRTYADAGCLVHAAWADQWALVVNEAMAAGLPVIVSSGTGSAADLVNNGQSGFIFESGNTSQLADHLGIIAADPALRQTFAENGRRIIADWTTQRFATHLAKASSIASRSSERSKIRARAILYLLEKASSSIDAFHSIET